MVDEPTQSPGEIRRLLRITCADAGALLSDFHDGALPPDDRALVAAHLGGCVACGVILDQIHTTTAILRSAAALRRGPDQDTVNRILAQVQGSTN